jgi:hypothetical protein
MDSNMSHDHNITLSEPGELIAAIPHLLGFYPVDSLVAVSLSNDETESVNATLRVDIPTSQTRECLIEQMIRMLTSNDSTAVILVVVGGCGDDDTQVLPHRDLIDGYSADLARAGIPVLRRLWAASAAAGSIWRCYDEADSAGSVPGSEDSPMALARVATGSLLYRKREDLAATLSPDDEGLLARRADLLAAANGHDCAEETDPAASRRRLHLVEAAVNDVADGRFPQTDEDIVALVVALSDHIVRDACLALGDSRTQAAAERLWTNLVRSTPVPERAEPACLLAFAAYQRGDGVLAGIAIELALEADPSHRLSGLVHTALWLALTPDQLRGAASRAAAHSREQMTGPASGEPGR